MPRSRREMPADRAATAFLAALLAAACLSACATTPPPRAAASADSPERTASAGLDRMLARAVHKNDWERAFGLADSVLAAEDPAAREIALYWKAVAWLYRDRPDSALSILEPAQSRWKTGLRKVHAGLLLKLAQDAAQGRRTADPRPESEPSRPSVDHVLVERLESLARENVELRAENERLQAEKEKYRTLLKDLEKIR